MWCVESYPDESRLFLIWYKLSVSTARDPKHPIDVAAGKVRQETGNPDLEPLVWLASSRKDLLDLPEEVQDSIGHALDLAQRGDTADYAKPLHGYGTGVWEIVDDYRTDTYRGVYVVRFAQVVFVLHCFQKKSRSGIAMPRPDAELIEQRLKDARELYESWQTQQAQKNQQNQKEKR